RFVGPSPESIEAMGSKVRAKELMADAGVPVLPSVTISESTDLKAAGGEVGFPLLVKAAFGGGGRGMRIVNSEDDLAESVASAQREAQSAFGDGSVFLERFVVSPRHVEVQVFGDALGNVVQLFERECSIQRRYQKIVEEAPSPAVDDNLRKVLGSAAVTAAKALGYVGAGTVEFVMDGNNDFYFLEVNTRLQVEHPVTEQITGLDLVELQLRVAAGEPLPPEALSASINGHAIEARLYAEDVSADFTPASGIIEHFQIPADEGIRIEAGYASGSSVSTYYDAMLAKIIAWGATRDQATRRLADTLTRTRVHGVPTNAELLVSVLRHREFHAGRTDTGFLERNIVPFLFDKADPQRPSMAVAAAIAAQVRRRRSALVQQSVPSGWRNVPTGLQRTKMEDASGPVDVGYRFVGSDLAAVEIDGEVVEEVRLWLATTDSVDLTLGGLRHKYGIEMIGDHIYVDGADATATFRLVDRFPSPEPGTAEGSLLAPMPGTVVRVLVSPGTSVSDGEILIVIEAMKMEHPIKSPYPGTVVAVACETGQQVDAGSILTVVEPAVTQNDT
ncbi:MAG TPA: biotin/lipoyl-containing protein, partial [Acidimicrobiales bacterium]|nr:biotin/lipoyl-containing protein [Acidimicrobiales bacterium]